MDRPRLYVDFNEMLERDLVLLSKADTNVDSAGVTIVLREGLRVYVYQDDLDEFGREDNLIAEGVVESCSGSGWAAAAKWCCRIDGGVRHESETRP